MNRLFNITLFVLITLQSFSLADEPTRKPNDNPGKIRHVTLYRDRALVTREILVPPGEAMRSITVPDLPKRVITDSIYADGVDDTIVRAVRVSRPSVAKPSPEELQRLEQPIHEVNRQRAETQHAIDTVAKDIEALNQMVNFAATAGKSDLDRGVLNADTLTKLTTFTMTQRRELAAERFQHQEQLQELDKRLKEFQAKLANATGRRKGDNHQASIFVETPKGAAGKVQLNYLVGGCGWSPQYTVHGQSGKDRVELRYSALVNQASGEDWQGVDFVLSTASPNVSAARPLLTALEVVTAQPQADDGSQEVAKHSDNPFSEPSAHRATTGNQDRSLTKMIESLRAQQQQAEASLNDAQFSLSSERRDLALNALAGQMQQIELQAKSQSWRNVAPDMKNHVASQVYTLPKPVSLDSRREQHVVQILETDLVGEMYYVATPLLSTFAYREFQTTNTQSVGFLGGPTAIYLDDRFVGRMQIPSTASGQRITIGFGADQQVRTRRELMDKDEVVQGGNRQLNFAYRLVVSNFKDKPIAVRLMDRMPHNRQTRQLSMKLVEFKEAISDDALYNRVLRPTGILRWDLTVPAGRHGSKAFDVDYSYTMEFDRSQIPTTEHSLAELQAQYQNVLMSSGMGGGFGGSFGGP